MNKNPHLSKYLKVRFADNSDLNDLFLWRNDFQTRKMFNNHKLIQIDEHKNWFKNVINKKNILLIVGFFPNSSEKIGSLRFDKSTLNKYFISINIAPKFRGKKLAKKFLSLSMEFFTNYETKFIAEIKKSNKASLNFFLSTGFKKFDESENSFFYDCTKERILLNS